MKSIDQIDTNFCVNSNLNKSNLKLYDSKNPPFEVFGLLRGDKKFCRIPDKTAMAVSEGVQFLYANTAGGRVRFKTNSSCVAISASMEKLDKMSHFALTGSTGFDLYSDNVYVGTFIPPFDAQTGYESIINLNNNSFKDITINFPLYSDVNDLYIGLDLNAEIQKAEPYKNREPVVYYGSSITQGGCASRPGMTYQSIISRRLDLDYINLGFSGSAKAEEEMSEYISNLAMSLFVYDYDHNAPTWEYLMETHEKMFKKIRSAKPDIPIIIMSRPKYSLTKDELKRRDIIKLTYENAIKSGDSNVYFIGGDELMKICGDDGTVDGVHCTDLGFFSMAKALGDLMYEIILKQ